MKFFSKPKVKHSRLELTKRWLIGCTAVMVLLGIIFLTASIVDNYRSSNERQKFSILYDQSNYLIESEGLSQNTLDSLSAYAQVMQKNDNYLVTDEEGKILFKANERYVLGDTFQVIVGSSSQNIYENNVDVAVVLDENQEMMYCLQFNGEQNDFSLINKSKKHPKYEQFFPSTQETQTQPQVQQDYVDEFTYSTVNRFDNYPTIGYLQHEYIAYKKLHIYRINSYYSYQERSINSFLPIVQLLIALAILLIPVNMILLSIWMFLDARKRQFNSSLWGILGLLTNVIGLIIYLVVRPEPKTCPKCETVLEKGFMVCPTCGYHNAQACQKCGALLKEEWSRCPYCAHPAQMPYVQSTAIPSAESQPLSEEAQPIAATPQETQE